MLTEIILFFVGTVVGAMNAVAGGGLLVGFPVLLAFGVPPIAANATGALVAGPGSLASAFGYRKFIRKVPKQYALLMIPCILGAAIGATLLRHTDPAKFDELVPLLVLLAVLLFAFQPFLHYQLHKHLSGKLKNARPLVLIGLALLPVAIYGGYFGAGFGFIMLAFLGFTKLHDMHQMNGLKNIAGACISITVLLCLFSAHLTDWKLGIAMGLGSVLGGYYGAHFSQRVSTHAVRIVIISTGLVTASYLAIHSYWIQ